MPCRLRRAIRGRPENQPVFLWIQQRIQGAGGQLTGPLARVKGLHVDPPVLAIRVHDPRAVGIIDHRENLPGPLAGVGMRGVDRPAGVERSISRAELEVDDGETSLELLSDDIPDQRPICLDFLP